MTLGGEPPMRGTGGAVRVSSCPAKGVPCCWGQALADRCTRSGPALAVEVGCEAGVGRAGSRSQEGGTPVGVGALHVGGGVMLAMHVCSRCTK